MNKLSIILATFIWLLVPTGSNYAAALVPRELPPEFEAVYEVRKGDIAVGEMQLSLRKQDDKLVYESRTYPVGIAALLLGPQIATYRAILERAENHYRTIKFEYEVQGNDKDHNELYTFDWDSHTVHSRYKGRNSILAISPHTFDRFSVQLLLMRKPDSGITRYTCRVISRGNLKEYMYRLEPPQPVQTQLGSFSAHKYIREKNDKKGTRYTEWYAEALYYIPVRSDKTSNGKTEISARITEVHWL